MVENNKKIAIGFITYGKATSKYLPYFLKSLRSQTFRDFNILAIDNSEEEENENSDYIKKNFPEIGIEWPGKNIGFARGYNRMMNKAAEEGTEYFLAVNPDMIFEADMLEGLIKAIQIDPKIAAVQPKILKWDFVNDSKEKIIDSLGLRIDIKHRFFDDKQGSIDDRLTRDNKEIFGFTGAAALLRVEALKDVAYKNQFFDELMFMYKEDCDLSYRLRLAGWKIILAPQAVSYHDRTASIVGESVWQIIKNRKNKSRKVKEWSFLNQLILLSKYKGLKFSPGVRQASYFYALKTIAFAVIFEPYLIKQLFIFWKLKNEISERRKALKIRVSSGEIEKWMK